MSQQVETPTRTYLASAALAKYRLMKLDGSGNLAYAGTSDTKLVGVLQVDALAVGDACAVRSLLSESTHKVVASEAITAGAACYNGADGKVAASGSVLRGFLLEAAGADGDIVEMVPSPSYLGEVVRASLDQEDLVPYTIPLTSLRVHDALQTNLPGTAAADDMAIITGTPGTNAPTLQGVDFGGTSTDEKGSFEFVLPAEYVAGETITCRLLAAMLTTISDGTATVDVEAWKVAATGLVGSDLCATAAQSINSLTPANKDFTITPTGLVAGDKLMIRLAFGGSDTGNLGVMIPAILNVQMLLDVKG